MPDDFYIGESPPLYSGVVGSVFFRPRAPMGSAYPSYSFAEAEAMCQQIAKVMEFAGWVIVGTGPVLQYMDGYNNPASVLAAGNLPPNTPYDWHTPGYLLRNNNGVGHLVWIRGTLTNWGFATGTSWTTGGNGVWDASGVGYSPRFRMLDAEIGTAENTSVTFADSDIVVYPTDGSGLGGDPGHIVVVAANKFDVTVMTETGRAGSLYLGSTGAMDGGQIATDGCMIMFSVSDASPWSGRADNIQAYFQDSGTIDPCMNSLEGRGTCGWVGMRSESWDKFILTTIDGRSIATAPGVQVYSKKLDIVGVRKFAIDKILLTEQGAFGTVKPLFGQPAMCLCSNNGNPTSVGGNIFSVWARI